MAMNDSLPTSGGPYYDDREGSSFVQASRRNVEAAKNALVDGEVGATVVATAAGFAIGKFLLGGR